MNDNFTTALAVLLIVAVVFSPVWLIYSINCLFGLETDVTLTTYVASLFLILVFSRFGRNNGESP